MMEEKKSEQNKMARRCFLTNCAKLAAGATFIGLNTKAFGKESDTWEDYEYCMYQCPHPCNFEPSCPGCKDATSGPALECTVRICVLDKELPSCAHCEDLADCDKSLWISYPSMKALALQKQAEWGLITGLSAASLKRNGFRSYPGVTKDGITITNRDLLEVDCRISDTLGRTVKKEKFNTDNYYLDLSGLTAGTYILNVVKDNKLLYRSKIIKN